MFVPETDTEGQDLNEGLRLKSTVVDPLLIRDSRCCPQNIKLFEVTHKTRKSLRAPLPLAL